MEPLQCQWGRLLVTVEAPTLVLLVLKPPGLAAYGRGVCGRAGTAPIRLKAEGSRNPSSSAGVHDVGGAQGACPDVLRLHHWQQAHG
jgi:hypothetical protein